jgi:AraC-like DNA-binding protein
MMVRRALPIGVSPQPGEVLESWLGTLAARLDMNFGDFLLGVGSSIGGIDLRRPGLAVYLTDRESAAVAASTGVEPALLHAMTLARYDGQLVSIHASSSRLRWSTWNPGRSRFCPSCLTASDGRWQLRWRLPWVFVCDVHGCLLVDVCPACGQAQRVSPRWLSPARIPDLQRCSLWTRDDGTCVPCGGDLRTAAYPALAESDPLAVAHARLAAVLGGAATRFGVYALSPVSSLQVLADLRVLSARMLAAIDIEALDDFLEVNGGSSIGSRVLALGLDLRRWGKPEVFTARASALITGIGIALALTVLGCESIHEAGDRLRGVIGRRGSRNRTATPGELRFGHLSPALEAVHLSAISGHFTASNKLRFRTTTAFPRYPRTDSTADGVALRQIPTALWRDWSLRLVARQRIHLDTVCSSLSPLLLIVGTRTSVADACEHLGGAVNASQQTIVLDALHRNPLWPNIAQAITRLAEHLIANPSPIDYQRRRQLHYEGLLPPEVWAQICDRAGWQPTDANHSEQLARSWMFGRISGQPADMSEFTRGIPRPHRQRDDLVERFTPDLITTLDGEATRFLHDHNVFDEPVQWSPPLNILSDLELPGPDLATVSTSELHLAMDVKSMTISAAARHLDMPTPCIRLLLERFPIEPAADRPSTQLQRLKACLTPQDLSQLHHRDALPIRTIAAQFGVHHRAVSTLAREYNLETRGARPNPRLTIDPGWFQCEYVEKHRTLTDIANEIGASISAVSRFATRHGIPVIRDPRLLHTSSKVKSKTDGPKTPPRGRLSAIDPHWLRREYVVNRRAASEVARELGVATSTVHRQVKKHGFTVPPHPTPKKPPKDPVVRPRRDVDPDWLRDEYLQNERTLTDIARDLGMSLSTLAKLAKTHGLEVKRGRPRGERKRSEPVKRRSKVDLDWLHREFVVNDRSLTDMARERGVTANTLRRHARQHHIGDAQRQAHNQTSIDLDWLHREYVINNRTLSDMAREIGMATSSLRRQAVKHGIGASMRVHPIGMSIGTLSAEVVGVDDERDDGKATAGWAETPA